MSDLLEFIKMEKIILNIKIPAISKDYDVLINPDMNVKDIIILLCMAVEDATNHSYLSSGSEILCSAERMTILRNDESIKKYGLKKGETLLLL